VRARVVVAIVTCVAVVVAITILYVVETKRHVYISAVSPDGRMVAEVAWKKVLPVLEGTEGWLIVEDLGGDSVIVQQKLFGGGDIMEDVTHEITGLAWRGDTIVLEAKGNRYKGPLAINVLRDWTK